MNTRPLLPLRLMSWFSIIVLSVTVISCNKKRKLVSIDPEFSRYIEAYTSGVISKKSAIRIQLASDAGITHTLNETVKEDLFDFSPSVSGKAYWIDARTIEFKPEKDLKPNELYEISFALGKVMNVPKKFKTFTFNAQVIKPAMAVQQSGLKAVNNSKDLMSLSGEINTADVEESGKIEKALKATLNGSEQKIKWQHNEVNKVYAFTIDSIKRGSSENKLLLEWDGSDLDMKQKDQQQIAVPAAGDFKVLGVRAVQDDEEFVLVQFSDPLAINQDLNGLIAISNQGDVSYTINGSDVKVYVAARPDGNYTASINPGIINQWGGRLDKEFTANVFFENRLPSVKIHGRGSILPDSGGRITLPFEATNLKAVDVSIIKIYESNIAQFLQQNDLNGETDLRRVAKPLVQATLKLDEDKSLNLHKKNRFSLDLDRYLRTEPGAIYRINIGFRPEYSLYTCIAKKKQKAAVENNEGLSNAVITTDTTATTVSQTAPAVEDMTDEEDDEEEHRYTYESDENALDDDDEFWSRYDTYYPYGYSWRQRDNPCSKSYYNRERFASRNILASNIGLTAKRGNTDELFVAVTNIISTEPIEGVDLEALDYQSRIISTGKSDGDGIATLKLDRKPYLLIAKRQDERGYLKIDNGSALPISRFDVSGEEVKNGIKGFIFGERGVWRPGDSLYLSCIVEDKENRLPEEHPIEMELYSPQGQLYKKLIQTNADDGFNVFRTATDADAPTGNWLCKVKVGGAVFEKKLKIETIMPNRLKINLDFGSNPALGKNSSSTGTLTARWLFGATAQNLKARVDVSLYKTATAFPKLQDFTFDNPIIYYSPQTKTIFDGALNSEGTAVIHPDFNAGAEAPGMLTANLLVKVFEPGGNFSIDNVALPYHPYTSYVGIKTPEGEKPWGYLLTGKTHQFNIVNVDTRGSFIPGTSTANVELYKIQWKWWWDNSGDDLSNFTQDKYNKLIKKQTIELNNGKGAYNLRIPAADWGRYLILVRDAKSGHITGKTFYVEDPYWQTRDNTDDPTAAAMLSFTLNKEKYNVGDEVTLNIPSSKGGRALISIESGSHVIKTFWTETQQGQTVFKFKAEKEMAPNVYANVSLLQPHARTINDLPIRMYGAIPVMIEDKNTILRPVIKMPDAIRPEQQSSIIVSEASGKDMTYVVALVDEGLLDLTRYKTPDPHKAFYSREALGVKSWDLFDFVIGAWGGDLERILTIGGDSEAEAPGKNNRANRFKPVVQFMGPFKSNSSAKTHTFTLPPYMGSVRAMVIAVNKGSYGFAEKPVAVKKPLMLLATMPRVLGPSEQLRIPVTVFATDNSIKNVSLSLQSNPFIEAGGTTKNISFTSPGEQLVYFDAKVKPSTGIGKIKLVATGGREKTVYDVEIDIRNPNPPITNISEATLNAGQSWNTTVSAIGTGGTNKASLEISSIPSINLQKRLRYLIEYPHGCVEQVTSGAFPQLVLNQLTDLNQLEKLQVDNNVRQAIERLRNFQAPDGGFSYWPNDGPSDEWGTSYAGHFLLEASERGFNVPQAMLQPWRAYERSQANAWNKTSPVYYGGDLAQAYRLYLLALAKAPELGAMNRLKEYRFITPEAKWRLAAAYYLAGQTDVALQLISGLPANFSERPSPGITFGSPLRDQAMVLETLTIMNRRAEAVQLVRAVAARLSQESWYSTQTTAYSLIAIAKFCGKNASGNKLMINGKVNGKDMSINSSSYLSQTGIGLKSGKGTVQITNKGNNVLYVRIINQGQPVSGDTMQVTNNPNVLITSVNFISSNGSPLNPAGIKQGTDFIAKVTVKNTGQRGTYNQMALSNIFPSGWEILNTRLYNSEGAFKSSPSEYMDIRDDRVYHYFDIRQNETLTYYVQLNAAYTGRFYWPGVYCYAMYDNSINAAVNGRWVEVTQ